MKKAILAMLLACAMLLTLAAPVSNAASGPNLVEVAISVNSSGPFAGQFDTLIAAVLAADPAVLKALTSPAKLTVFAPTDDAFDELGLNKNNIGTLDQRVLTDILLYHVARGELMAGDVVAREKIRTVYGDFLKVDGTVLTDNLKRKSNIIATDVMAGNGVIHAIDAVVLPYDPANPPVADTLLEAALKLNAEGPFAGQFDTLIAAVLAADPVVANALSGRAALTVFAPTDEAFAALGLDENNIGTLDQGVLTEILLYHVARGELKAVSVLSMERIRTVYGDFLRVDGAALVDNLGRSANIIATDVMAGNGVIHAIDAVVLPYDPANPPLDNLLLTALAVNSEGPFAGQFDTLIAAVLAADRSIQVRLAGLYRTTVFAPTDGAFEELGLNESNIASLGETALTEILRYHMTNRRMFSFDVVETESLRMLWGGQVRVEGTTLTDNLGRASSIIVTDVQSRNGIIHAINRVLLPYDPAMPPVMNIVDTAISLNSQGTYAGQFDTLIAALLAADPAVLQALSGPSRRTVFAPTDGAFAALGLNPGNVGTLGEEALTDILLYHVAQGKRFSTEVVSQNLITTLSGKKLMVDGATLIDRMGRPANIIVTDIQASNGIIHAIDSVLLPGA